MAFKVIIVGAGVAGLALANILEKSGIQFTILEAHPTIAPQVGACIGLLPNGLRILDQLGCYEKIRERIDNPYHKIFFHASNGQVLNQTGETTANKTNIVTGQRVEKVKLLEYGVQVHTAAGDIFTGDVLVGADGIHSTVRTEMWRLGAENDPSHFDRDEESRIKSNTKCIFGISKRPAKFPRDTQHVTLNDGRSYWVVSAPGDRVYWFLFCTMDVAHGRHIPRFTKADEKNLVEQYLLDHVTEDMTFSEVYEQRLVTSLVALEEQVFCRWFYNRIITIGDSAHKVHPITKQGGNGAIETAAMLANALMGLANLEATGQLNENDVETAFEEVQAGRFERMTSVVAQGQWISAFVCQKLPFSSVLARLTIPFIGDNIFLYYWIKWAHKGTLIQGFNKPVRAHTAPYYDELENRRGLPWAPLLMVLVGLGVFVRVLSSHMKGNLAVD